MFAPVHALSFGEPGAIAIAPGDVRGTVVIPERCDGYDRVMRHPYTHPFRGLSRRLRTEPMAGKREGNPAGSSNNPRGDVLRVLGC